MVDPGRPGLSDEAALLTYLKRCRYLRVRQNWKLVANSHKLTFCKPVSRNLGPKCKPNHQRPYQTLFKQLSGLGLRVTSLVKGKEKGKGFTFLQDQLLSGLRFRFRVWWEASQQSSRLQQTDHRQEAPVVWSRVSHLHTKRRHELAPITECA